MANVLEVVFFDHFFIQKNPRFRPKFAQKHFLAKNGPKFGRRYYEKEEMVLVVAVVADPAGMGQRWLCWWWWLLYTPPAGAGCILLFLDCYG